MKTYQFKTNINCSGCIAKITPHLDANDQIKNWKVNTLTKDKILMVEADQLSSDTIENIVKNAGFQAQLIEG